MRELVTRLTVADDDNLDSHHDDLRDLVSILLDEGVEPMRAYGAALAYRQAPTVMSTVRAAELKTNGSTATPTT